MKTMKGLLAILLALLMLLGAAACSDKPSSPGDGPQADDPATEEPEDDSIEKTVLNLYVVSGSADGGDGSEAKPFATLEAARDAIRAADRKLYKEINVYLSGRFYRTETLALNTEADSGSARCPVSWIGLDNAEITGGIVLTAEDFSALEDSEAQIFPEEARSSIVKADLSKFGLGTEDFAYGDLTSYQNLWMNTPFCGSTRLTPARYPDTGYTSILNPVAVDGNYQFSLSEADAARARGWNNKENIYIKGFFAVYWSGDFSKVLSFADDCSTMVIKNDEGYPPQENLAYYWYNIPEELNLPGEYYITADGILYYYPIADENGNTDIVYPACRQTLIDIAGNYVTLKNITLGDVQGNAIKCNGDYNTVTECLIRRVGGNHAITMEGMHLLFSDSEIANVAYSGIQIRGGDTNTLTSSENLVTNNYIHNFSEAMTTYQGAVYARGVGVTVSHNEIAHSNHLAIHYEGNNHIFEYNEVYDVCNLSDDAGACYAGRTFEWYGNAFRYNYFHEIGDVENELYAYGGNGVHAIYWDDGLAGQSAYGNVFVNVAGNGINASGGPDTLIQNNISINCVSCVTDLAVKYVQIFINGMEVNNLLASAQEKAKANPEFAAAFPTLLEMNDDKDEDNEWYWANPCRITFTDNANFCLAANSGTAWGTRWGADYTAMFCDPVKNFNDVENNEIYTYGRKVTLTPEEAIEQAGFDIPFDQIGRNK